MLGNGEEILSTVDRVGKEETGWSEGWNNSLERVACCDRLLRSLFTVMVAVLSIVNKIIARTPDYKMQFNDNRH